VLNKKRLFEEYIKIFHDEADQGKYVTDEMMEKYEDSYWSILHELESDLKICVFLFENSLHFLTDEYRDFIQKLKNCYESMSVSNFYNND
jgi:hypothetical protein